tara:strand:- start:5144 stop:5860 length:717 start_codon:yes stop_codon:yes gene_type:complete
MKVKNFLNDEYCKFLSDRLWKNRISWAQMVASSIENDSIVLDVGAGTCLFKENFKHCKYLSQDFIQLKDQPYGDIDIVSDITSIPLKDDYADVVFCTEVLEHLPEPIKAIKEFHRLLKSKGKLIITAPLGSGQHQKPFHFYGGYTRFFYEKFLNEIGFEIEVIENNGSIYGHIIEKIWRTSENVSKIRERGGIISRLKARLVQTFFYNLPTLYFYEKEQQNKHEEDFTVGFHIIAQKK